MANPVYRIYQEFLTNVKDLYYIEAPATESDIKARLMQEVTRKYRQGYTSDENGEQVSTPAGFEDLIATTTEPDELVVTMMRVPFQGSTGDPETFEVTYTNTGMTETIILHAELTPRQRINPCDIPIYPINPGGK